MKWIPKKEDRPNEDMRCLITVISTEDATHEEVFSAYYHKSFFGTDHYWWCDELRTDIPDKKVLAWMPMPKPYKEGGKQ